MHWASKTQLRYTQLWLFHLNRLKNIGQKIMVVGWVSFLNWHDMYFGNGHHFSGAFQSSINNDLTHGWYFYDCLTGHRYFGNLPPPTPPVCSLSYVHLQSFATCLHEWGDRISMLAHVLKLTLPWISDPSCFFIYVYCLSLRLSALNLLFALCHVQMC